MSHNSLKNYYETIFGLKQHHKWGIEEIENLIPFERDNYLGMLKKHFEEQEKKKAGR